MKFTIDLENKKVLIHDEFKIKDIDALFSILNIPDKEEWSIDKFHVMKQILYPPYQPIGVPNQNHGNDIWYYNTTTTDFNYNQGTIYRNSVCEVN